MTRGNWEESKSASAVPNFETQLSVKKRLRSRYVGEGESRMKCEGEAREWSCVSMTAWFGWEWMWY